MNNSKAISKWIWRAFVIICWFSNTSCRKLPKDEIIVSKAHESMVEKSRDEYLSSRVKSFARVSTRDPSSPEIAFIWTPNVTRRGAWELEWKYCPKNSFVQGMKIHYIFDHKPSKSIDTPGIHKIEFFCHDFFTNEPERSIVTGGGWNFDGQISLKKNSSCPGAINEMSARSMPDMGCQDDQALVNLKLTCATHGQTQIKLDSNYSFSVGEWSQSKKCPFNSAICGVRSQIDLSPADNFGSNFCNNDGVGISNIAFACCLIEDPGFLCIPTINWKTRDDVIGYVNNRCRKSDDKGTPICSVKLKHGLEYAQDSLPRLTAHYEHLGFPILGAVGTLGANFLGSFSPDVVQGLNITDRFVNVPLKIKLAEKFVDNCDKSIQELIFECDINNKNIVYKLYKMHTGIYRCK